jgi:hypothetical protein
MIQKPCSFCEVTEIRAEDSGDTLLQNTANHTLHGVTTQKTTINIFNTMKTSNFKQLTSMGRKHTLSLRTSFISVLMIEAI